MKIISQNTLLGTQTGKMLKIMDWIFQRINFALSNLYKKKNFTTTMLLF